VRLDRALAPGRGALRAVGLPAHPRRIDHLLFLLLLVVAVPALPAARGDRHRVHRRALDHVIAAGARLRPGGALFPVLIEVLIALHLYMAIENFSARACGRRWILALAFGLVHGFGFAYGLRELLQFAARTWSRRCRFQRRRGSWGSWQLLCLFHSCAEFSIQIFE